MHFRTIFDPTFRTRNPSERREKEESDAADQACLLEWEEGGRRITEHGNSNQNAAEWLAIVSPEILRRLPPGRIELGSSDGGSGNDTTRPPGDLQVKNCKEWNQDEWKCREERISQSSKRGVECMHETFSTQTNGVVVWLRSSARCHRAPWRRVHSCNPNGMSGKVRTAPIPDGFVP